MTRADRLRLWAAWGAPALAVGLVVLAVNLTSHHQSHRVLSAAIELLIGWSFAVAGLVALTRRPENNTGRLLVWVGVALFVGTLNAANDRVLYTLGEALGAVDLALFVHLLLVYPQGALQSRRDRVTIACGYALAVLANVGTLMFTPHPQCDSCASNLLLVTHRDSVARAVTDSSDVLAVLLLGWVLVLLVRRWRSSTAVVRTALRSVFLTGGLALLLLVIGFAAGPASRNVETAIQTGGLFVFASVPYAFLVGLLRIRLAPAAATRALVGVSETATLEETQSALRSALGDPMLRVGTWLPERELFVDSEGHHFPTAEEDPTRVLTEVASPDGAALALIEHDAALLSEPELLQSAIAAARLSLHRNRLQDELRARLGELQRERDFIADVVNAAPAFFCVIDLEGRIVRYNDRLAAVTGRVDDENTRGRLFWDIFAVPADADGVRWATLAVSPGEHEHRWRGRDGRPLVVAWSLTQIRDGEGNERLVITGLDVSDRARHADDMRRERDFHSRVGQATPTLLCVAHSDGVVDERGVNQAFAQATGVGDADAVGRRFWELVALPGEEDAIRLGFLQAIQTGESAPTETAWRSSDDEPLIVEWWVTSLEAYRPDHYLVCANDITKRKQDEDEIRRSRARLVAAADAERRRLERNLHDGAQQRLVTLSLSLRLVEQLLDRDPHKAREIMAEAGAELGHALQELRELARGLHPAVLADRGLGAALEALTERSSVPVELRIGLAERLPAGIEVAIFYVVSEALTNVAKYAGATVAVVDIEQSDGQVSVVVADDGAGGADPADGTGLRGLMDRVAALDGTLELESPIGTGTRIRATFPLAGVRQAEPQEAGYPHSA